MKLYKYVSAARMDILTGQRIRFSQQLALNDPFENSPHYADVSKKFFDHTWSIERNRLESKPNRDILAWFINHNFVSLSLTTKNDNLLMWAHYTVNHTGFVIELDSEHPFFNDNTRHLYKVPYSQVRSTVKLRDCEQLVLEVSDSLKTGRAIDPNKMDHLIELFRKSEDWSYEDEWRLLANPELAMNYNAKEHGFHLHISRDRPINEGFSSDYCALYKLPPDCISAIYCGAKINTGTARQLYFLTNSNSHYEHIDLKLATIDDKEFKLNFKDLSEIDILTLGELEYEAKVREGNRTRILPKWYHFSSAASYERERRKMSS